jgi:hypothetical protein
MPNSSAEPGPRVLRDDLGALEARDGAAARAEGWSCEDPVLERIGSWSGPALALAFLAARLRAGAGRATELPFLVSVGAGVRRGLPTAARASVIARAPLTGRIGQGQVGGDLGERLAAVADLLALDGRTELAGAVLIIDDAARVEPARVPSRRRHLPRRTLPVEPSSLRESARRAGGERGSAREPRRRRRRASSVAAGWAPRSPRTV